MSEKNHRVSCSSCLARTFLCGQIGILFKRYLTLDMIFHCHTDLLKSTARDYDSLLVSTGRSLRYIFAFLLLSIDE